MDYYTIPENTEKKGLRNSLVLPGDPDINDQGRSVTVSELEHRFAKELEVARFAYEQQREFVTNLLPLLQHGQRRAIL